jgi:hypothetical protein
MKVPLSGMVLPFLMLFLLCPLLAPRQLQSLLGLAFITYLNARNKRIDL